MQGQVKIDLDDYTDLITEHIELGRRFETVEEKYDRITSELIELIDAEFDKALESSNRYIEPFFISIESVAKIIGLDWDDMVRNWKAEKEERNNEKNTQ